jgi:hypothetical protein
LDGERKITGVVDKTTAKISMAIIRAQPTGSKSTRSDTYRHAASHPSAGELAPGGTVEVTRGHAVEATEILAIEATQIAFGRTVELLRRRHQLTIEKPK